MAGIKEKEYQHEKRIEMSPNSSNFDCDLCSVKIPSQLSLNMHMKEYKLELVSKELNHFGVIACLFRQIGGHSSRFVLFCSF